MLLVAPALSLLVLAAHFLRAGQIAGLVLALAALPLLLVRRPIVLRGVQLLLVIGVLEWSRTLIQIARIRIALDEPFARMALILTVVTLLTAASVLLLEKRPQSD